MIGKHERNEAANIAQANTKLEDVEEGNLATFVEMFWHTSITTTVDLDKIESSKIEVNAVNNVD